MNLYFRLLLWSFLAIWTIGVAQAQHDRFIELIERGEAKDVPELLRGLAALGDTKPDESMVCTKGHCLEALANITNQYVGANHADWKRWWDANRRKSRDEWVRDGFRVAGLPVSNPPDEAYCRALIRLLAQENTREHLTRNAVQILKQAPRKVVESSVEHCMISKDRVDRLGVLVCIAQLEISNATVKLRKLTADEDREVRQSALSKLNVLVGKAKTVKANITEIDITDEVRLVAPGASESQFFFGTHRKGKKGGGWHLLSYDVEKQKIIWERECSDIAESPPVVQEHRFFFTCYDGKLYCADIQTGEIIWHAQTEGHRGRGGADKLFLLDRQVIVPMEKFLWSFSQEKGETLWKLEIDPVLGQAATDGRQLFLITEDKRLLAVSRDGKILREVKLEERAWSVCADDKNVYVSWGQKSAKVTAYSGESLAVVWQAEIGRLQTWNCVDLLTASDLLLVRMDYTFTALERSSGNHLWTTQEDAQSTKLWPLGTKFVVWAGSLKRGIELRDLRTGETTSRLVTPNFVYYLHASEKTVVGAAFKGKPWFLRMP